MIMYALCQQRFTSDDLFCFQSRHCWRQHFCTCCITSANGGQVGYFRCWSGHFIFALKVFQELFRWIKCQIGPYANVYDFEFNEESNHLVWHKCSKHFLANHANGCVHCKFVFNFNIQDVQHIHDQFHESCTTIKNTIDMNLFWWGRNYLGLAFCCGSPKKNICWPSHQPTSWLPLNNRMLEVCCSLCIHKGWEGKAGFQLGNMYVPSSWISYW